MILSKNRAPCPVAGSRNSQNHGEVESWVLGFNKNGGDGERREIPARAVSVSLEITRL